MENTTYELIDNYTGRVLGRYTWATRNRGRNRKDKLDMQHGGTGRYTLKANFA